MTTDAEVTAVSDRLTKAQRAAILEACTTHCNVGGEPFVTVDFTDPWDSRIAQFLTVRTDRLTPFGLRVRAHLLAQAGAGERGGER